MPSTSFFDRLGGFSQDPESDAQSKAAAENSDHNVPCYLFTKGQLPWGVCSTGLDENRFRLGRVYNHGVNRFTMWRLVDCSLLSGMALVCPDPGDPFCGEKYDPISASALY